MSTYSEQLARTNLDIAEIKSEFITQLSDGTLPVAKFRDFVIQSHLCNRQFKKFVAILSAKFSQHFEHTTKSAASKVLGKVIADNTFEVRFEKLKNDLKITDAEIKPSLVTKGLCDYLLMIAYNQGYKEALVVAVVLKSIHEKHKHLFSGPSCCGSNPLYREYCEEVHKNPICNEFFQWAEITLNNVMNSQNEVTPKHRSVAQYMLQWRVAFLEASFDKEKWKWPLEA